MSYFSNRFIDETNRLFEAKAGATEAELAKQYQAVYRRINRELRLMYNDIKGENITSIAELYRFQNYYELVNLLNEELDGLANRQIIVIEPELKSLYLTQAKFLGKTFGLSGTIRKDLAEDAVKAYWCKDGLQWSDRIWRHRAQLAERIEAGLIDCAVRGASSRELTQELQKVFGVSYNEASRLVRTEMSYVQNRATLEKYDEAGVEYYEILDTGDDRECDECASVVGRRFRLEDAEPGVNFPPLHPNCRCCVVAVLPEEESKKSQYRKQGETPAGVVQGEDE